MKPILLLLLLILTVNALAKPASGRKTPIGHYATLHSFHSLEKIAQKCKLSNNCRTGDGHLIEQLFDLKIASPNADLTPYMPLAESFITITNREYKNSSEMRHISGLAYFLLGKHQQSLEEMRKAIELSLISEAKALKNYEIQPSGDRQLVYHMDIMDRATYQLAYCIIEMTINSKENACKEKVTDFQNPKITDPRVFNAPYFEKWHLIYLMKTADIPNIDAYFRNLSDATTKKSLLFGTIEMCDIMSEWVIEHRNMPSLNPQIHKYVLQKISSLRKGRQSCQALNTYRECVKSE